MSKRFRLISKDPFFRTRWFVTKYQPYEVLFEAIARGGKIFTVDLFQRLLRAGAILSRSLTQLLAIMCIPSEHRGPTGSQWGRSISFDAWMAVLTEARTLVSPTHLSRASEPALTPCSPQYGPIPLDKVQLDSLNFNSEPFFKM